MNKNDNNTFNDASNGISSKALGNYTKGAVKNFEQNIVSQTNYLEKVDSALKDEKKPDD